MKRKLIFIVIIILLILPFYNRNTHSVETNNINYNENITGLEQVEGTYTSTDGKTITVSNDGTIKYLDTYTLTITQNSTGNVISGKLGTDKKTATLYQLNPTTIVSGEKMTYKHNSISTNLYEFTAFKTTASVIPDLTGSYEIWRNDSKVNVYKTLQDAVDSALSGDTIKITKDIIVTEGVYINKDIIIEGNNHTLDKSKWLNPLFVIEEDTTVDIKNITIDGGEKTYELDFTTTTPSIKNNTTNENVKSRTSIITSKGNLKFNKVNIQNHYSVKDGSTVRVLRGKANFKNSKFNHNLGNELAIAIRTGSTLKPDDKSLPVEELIVENCEFNNNYVPGGSGGAILLANVTTTRILNSKFYRNIVTTTSSGGGAIYYDTTGQVNSESLNIDYPKIYVESSTFEENYSGNDGFAFSNDSAHFYINNSKFIKNVGLDPSSSVGAVSCMSNASSEYDAVITNTIFEENKGPVAGFGEHGTLAKVKMDNVTFEKNEGNIDILIYQGNSTLQNMLFKNERMGVGIIDIRTHYNATSTPKYQPNTITLKDITFENNNTPAEIFIRKNNHNTKANIATVNLEGTIKGNIDIIDGQKLNINGTVKGNIHSEDTLMENIITESSQDKSTYTLNRYSNHYIATINFPLDKDNTPSVEYLYLEKDKTYTEKDIFMMLRNENEGYTMKIYTDSSFTTPWTYTSSSNINLYGKWEEHEHVFDGKLIVEDNIIYEQCILGHFGKKISLSLPTEITANDKEIPVIVNNELSVDNYKVVYYVKEENSWKELSTIPKEEGTYKAVLTYNNLNIEKEYIIKKEEVIPSEPEEPSTPTEPEDNKDKNEIVTPEESPKQENPNTGNAIVIIAFICVISFLVFGLIYKKLKPKHKYQN